MPRSLVVVRSNDVYLEWSSYHFYRISCWFSKEKKSHAFVESNTGKKKNLVVESQKGQNFLPLLSM